MEQSSAGKPDEEVPQWRRIENVRVIDNREHWSVVVAQAELLRLLRERGHGGTSPFVLFLLIAEQGANRNATAVSDTPVSDLASLEYPNQERPRDAKQVCGPLSRELGLEWDEADGVAVGEFSEHVGEQLRRSHGKHDLLLVWLAHQQPDRGRASKTGLNRRPKQAS